ncbi:hypothetical protein KDM41_04225 [bacterium]|nr:hypothetical protein [bacterium]
MTRKRFSLFLFALAALGVPLLLADIARAQCASPATSTFPQIMTVCPSGDITYSAVLRDPAAVPCPNEALTMVFGGSCPVACNGVSVFSAVSGPTGIVQFSAPMGACCAGSASFVDVAGFQLAVVPLIVSPDLNADCRVDLSDLAAFAGLYSTGVYNRCADFNGDGILNLADLTVFAIHFGH